MQKPGLILLCAVAAFGAGAQGTESFNVPREEINVRDPFIVPDPAAGLYRIYTARPWEGGDGVGVRRSRDLQNWTERKLALELPPELKSQTTAYWAPEVHKYRDNWYMFVTLLRKGVPKGTWIFRSALPDGPFLPVSDKAATPAEWECLDGTLWVEDGKPFMVFCHEWTQIGNGEMCLMPLKDDLSGPAGEPVTLFKASDYSGKPPPKRGGRHVERVTDGPFLYRSPKSGKLFMIWSNVTAKHGYTEILCESETGRVAGPWKNFRVIFGKDGGHGMLFRRLDGRLTLTLHSPNGGARERMRFFDVEDTGDGLRVISPAPRPASAEAVKRAKAAGNLILNGDFEDGTIKRHKGEWEQLAGDSALIAPWTCESGNAGLAKPGSPWLGKGIECGRHALFIQTCNYSEEAHTRSGDTSVVQTFDVPEKGDYRLGLSFTGRPHLYGAILHIRLFKGRAAAGKPVFESTVAPASDKEFVKWEAFTEIAEPGVYTLQLLQKEPEKRGVNTDRSIAIDNVEFVRDRLFTKTKETQAASSPAKYDIAALVYPGYHPEPRWQSELGLFKEGIGEWQNVKEARPKWKGHRQPRRPVWGYCNEADPKVMEKKIEAASSHGVNVFIYDWYWYGGRPFLEGALHDGFLGAENNGKMKFFLMWANHHFGDTCNNKVSRAEDKTRYNGHVNPVDFRAMTRRAIDMFFSRPNYYKIDGKPVFMVYELGTMVNGLGGTAKAAEAMRQFNEDCKAAGFPGVHLMACSWSQSTRKLVQALGFESATMYTYAHHVGGSGDYRKWAAAGLKKLDSEKRRLGVKDYFAHASIGWDTNPRFPERLGAVENSTPENFEEALRGAKAWCDANTRPGRPKLISINAWNEWIEGSYLEPDETYGMGFLEAIRKVFK